jgi:hypothetical protein
LNPVGIDDPHPQTQRIGAILSHHEGHDFVRGPPYQAVFVPIGVAPTLLIVLVGSVVRRLDVIAIKFSTLDFYHLRKAG